MPFALFSEALSGVPDEPEWAWEGYLAPRALTLLAGRPKAGKSTLTFGLLAALTDGRSFLGRPTKAGGVLVLSEERQDSLKEKELRFGLEGNVHLLMRHEVREETWPEIVAQAVAHCKEHDLGVLVVDTFDKWHGLKGEEENSAGAILEALQPLALAAGEGLAVLIVVHQRKAGGNFGEAVRGNNALTGGVDVVAELERAPSGAGSTGTRVLRATSRFAATPEETVVELVDDEYRVHGDLDVLRGEDGGESRLQAALSTAPATVRELAEEAGIAQATARRRLKAWAKEGSAGQVGSGRRGDPHRFFLPTSTPEDETNRDENGGSE